MLTTDFTKKLIHIAVAVVPDHEQPLHQGLIFNPEGVFSKVNDLAEDYFAEFFQTGREYRLFCMETEMGPGELVKVFAERFEVEYSMWVGGIIAPFTIKPANMERFCKELTKKQSPFLKSKEKKFFTRNPIRGVTIKV